MNTDQTIWGPIYWKTMHSICLGYPLHPNSVTKKKYYDFFHNIPLFLPNHKYGDDFAHLLEKYPLQPYLDSRDQLTKWMHFIHNIINKKLNKPHFSYNDYIVKYTIPKKKNIIKKKICIGGPVITIVLLFVVIALIKK